MWPRIAATLLFFAAFEGLIFHTRLYPSIVEPDSTTGSVELRIRTEVRRAKQDHNQVLALGNSRMSFLPRIASQVTPPTGYTFASVAAPGTYTRGWYYIDRSVDPNVHTYAAILVPSDDYDERDKATDLDDYQWELNYLLARLELRDLFEFAASHRDASRRWAAFRGVLLKGFVYKRDFREFLLHPRERLVKVKDRDLHWAQWAYDYAGTEESLAGLEIDWQQGTAQIPERISDEQREVIADTILADPGPDTGRSTAYYRYWYGKILDRYRGSGTKIIFLRLPRGPVSPPQHPPKPTSAVRQLASRPNVTLLDEHLFDSLERPELFQDPLHLNRPGMEKFSRMLAIEVARALGQPQH
ncbi:MAG TPA: SGNH/GDSL hydrolase family protein [Bryobacteraceae bacterium]|nr:SGNH/GDSL hydrolase family protein [Bryobacteraceae bacterium]